MLFSAEVPYLTALACFGCHPSNYLLTLNMSNIGSNFKTKHGTCLLFGLYWGKSLLKLSSVQYSIVEPKQFVYHHSEIPLCHSMLVALFHDVRACVSYSVMGGRISMVGLARTSGENWNVWKGGGRM
jgi:hypothetical protein